MTQDEAIKIAVTAFNECSGSVCPDMNQLEVNLLENYAISAIDFASKGDWESALRWTRRCINMEKKVGHSNAPLWGEFGEAIERICQEFLDSGSE